MRTQQTHIYQDPPPQHHASPRQNQPRRRRRLRDHLADAWSHRWVRLLVLLCLALLALLASDRIAALLRWLLARGETSAVGPVAPLFLIELLLYVLVEWRWLRRATYAQASTIRMHAFVTFTLTGTLGTLISFGSTAEGSFDQAVQSTIVGVVLGLSVLVYDAYRALHDTRRTSDEQCATSEHADLNNAREQGSSRPNNSRSSASRATHGPATDRPHQPYYYLIHYPQEHQQHLPPNGRDVDLV